MRVTATTHFWQNAFILNDRIEIVFLASKKWILCGFLFATVHHTELCKVHINQHAYKTIFGNVWWGHEWEDMFRQGPDSELTCKKTLYRTCMFLRLWLGAQRRPLWAVRMLDQQKAWGNILLVLLLQLVMTSGCKLQWEADPVYNKEVFIIQSWKLRRYVDSGLRDLSNFSKLWFVPNVKMLKHHLYLTFCLVVFICLTWSIKCLCCIL